MSPLHPTVSCPREFQFHNSTDKKDGRKGRVIFIELKTVRSYVSYLCASSGSLMSGYGIHSGDR